MCFQRSQRISNITTLLLLSLLLPPYRESLYIWIYTSYNTRCVYLQYLYGIITLYQYVYFVALKRIIQLTRIYLWRMDAEMKPFCMCFIVFSVLWGRRRPLASHLSAKCEIRLCQTADHQEGSHCNLLYLTHSKCVCVCMCVCVCVDNNNQSPKWW